MPRQVISEVILRKFKEKIGFWTPEGEKKSPNFGRFGLQGKTADELNNLSSSRMNGNNVRTLNFCSLRSYHLYRCNLKSPKLFFLEAEIVDFITKTSASKEKWNKNTRLAVRGNLKFFFDDCGDAENWAALGLRWTHYSIWTRLILSSLWNFFC